MPGVSEQIRIPKRATGSVETGHRRVVADASRRPESMHRKRKRIRCGGGE